MTLKKIRKRKHVQSPAQDDSLAKKQKRVSFAESFETRVFGINDKSGFNNSTKESIVEMQEKPRKSILKTKATRTIKKVFIKKEERTNNHEEMKCFTSEKTSTSSSVEKQTTQRKSNKKNAKNLQLSIVACPKKPINRKKMIKVKRSTKEILMNMNKKERREFIRQLEEKNKPNFELLKKSKVLWEKIRSSKTSESEKENCVQKLLQLYQGKYTTLIHSHIACRIIQTLLKLKRPEIRRMIFEELKPEIVRMTKSKYAKYFVVKMLKYGSKQQRDEVINALKGHAERLYKIVFSAELLDSIYSEWATAEQCHSITSEFYGLEFVIFQNEFTGPVRLELSTLARDHPEKLTTIVNNLEKILQNAVQKIPILKLSITHRLILDYLTYCNDDQKQTIIDSLKDNLPEICHTKEGSRAALICIWNANANYRKSIVKSFKGLAIRSCQDYFARRVLFGIFDTVDDTILVNKIIISDIANNIADIIYDKNGIWVLHYLVHPRDYRVIGKGLYELLKEGDSNPHSKKISVIRYSELFERIKPALLDFMKANMRDMITNKVSAVLILDTLELDVESKTFKCNIPIQDIQQCFGAISEIAADEFIPHSVDGPSHIVQGGCQRFVFRKLLQSDPLRENDSKLSDFLSDISADNLSSWTGMDCGCYTLVEMLKSGSIKAIKAINEKISVNSLKKSSLNGAKVLLEQLAKTKCESTLE